MLEPGTHQVPRNWALEYFQAFVIIHEAAMNVLGQLSFSSPARLHIWGECGSSKQNC